MIRRALVLVTVVALAACGGSKSAQSKPAASGSSPSDQSTTTTTITTTTSSAGAVDPNAPEPNAAGDIPDTQKFVPVTIAAGPFTISTPEGWARADSTDSTTFTDNFNSVELRVISATAAPTPQSARDNEVPAIQAAAANFQLDGITSVSRKGGAAVLITYRADSAPSPVTGKVRPLAIERYEFWQGGKEAVVVLSGPVGADNVDPWKTITDSFAWA